MTIFCDNNECMFIDEDGFCDCDKLNIVGGVCEGSYHGGRTATESDVDDKLKAENAKLRKMVEEMHPFAKAYMSDAMIFGCVDDKSFGWEMCMRELGIEVKQ